MQSILKAHRIAVLCAAVFCLFSTFGTAQEGIPEPQPVNWGPPSIDEVLSGNRTENRRDNDSLYDRDARHVDVGAPLDERSILRQERPEAGRPAYHRSADRRDEPRTARRRGASQRRPPRRGPLAWSPARSGLRRPPWQGTLMPNPDRRFGNPPFVVIDRTGSKRRYIRQSPNIDLKRRLYQTAIVHEDTGLVLSASQLDFPFTQNGELEDDRYADARHDRGNAIRGRMRMEQAAYENDYRNDDYSYEFEDALGDQYGGTYGGYDPVYTAQHFEELPPGVPTGPPIIETGPGGGGNYLLDEGGPARYETTGGWPWGGGNSGLFGLGGGLGLGQGGLFGQFGRLGGGYSAERCVGGNCFGRCESGQCGGTCTTGCGSRTKLPSLWVNADYFVWWTRGMYLPPLVTTSPAGTDLAEAGRLGFSDTQVLYGGREVLTDRRDGGRLRGGFRIAPRFGIQADYFGLEKETNRYRASGTDGTPIITRPFFDIMRPADVGGNVIPAEGRRPVSFPAFNGDPAISGTITVNTAADLESFGITGRYGLFGEKIDGGDYLPGRASRIDILAGYRYMQLDEGLLIRENLNTISDDLNPVTFDVRESFRTHNDFHGGEIGTIWEWEEERWSIELLAKLAVGSTRQLVVINGRTDIGGDVAFPGTYTGGLLAQTSNIGSHKRHELSVIPELGATIAYRVTDRLRLTGGYTFIYWSRVARPGEHVDLDVNRNLIPNGDAPPVADPGPLRPVFAWTDTDFWAQGVNAGLDYRW